MRRSRRTWGNAPPRPGSPVVAPPLRGLPDETRRNALTKRKTRDELAADELEQEDGEELPEREAMSLIDANVAAPVNAAAALNVLNDDSTAVAKAEQATDIDKRS
jgi:hypothetical protein